MMRRNPTSDDIFPTPVDAGDESSTDDGPEHDTERGPLRRCIVTRESLSPDVMVRFVVAPGRLLMPDVAARLPGRGIWLSASQDVLETARKRGVFSRAARTQVIVPDDLPQLLEDALARRIFDTLGLMRRAGQIVCGFVKAREWIAGGRAAAVVQAEDGSPEERGRLLSGARALPVVSVPTAKGLGAAFGRDHVVHAAVAPGTLAQRLLVDNERIRGLSGRAAQVRRKDSPDFGEQAGT